MGIRWIAKLNVGNYEAIFVFKQRPTWQQVEEALVDAFNCELLGTEYHTLMSEMPSLESTVWDRVLEEGLNEVVGRELEVMLTRALG
jgi:hypothetical protein